MLPQKIQQFINQQKLFSTDQKLLVGVSGGIDSVVLIHILYELGYSCVVAHCNFHLRGEESNRDARFVESLALKLNLPFRHVNFQTEEYAAEQKISIEMAARELRYNWFAELKEKENADYIVIAHHADDVVETFLINMTRGTGISGLTGIKPKNNDIVRPLLCASRNEIIAYSNENEISFVEDSTNQEEIYVRNKFRNRIIPLFQEINPSFRESVLQTIQNLQKTEQFVDEKIDAIKNDITAKKDGNIYISIDKLKAERDPAYVLYEILHPYGFAMPVVSDIFNGLDAISGKQYFAAQYRVVKDREWLILSKRKQEKSATYTITQTDEKLNKPLGITISHITKEADFSIRKDKSICYLDEDKLTFPLQIRRWERGDFFVPFGMKNKKKVSDFFVDQRFSLLQKEQTWLLLSGGQIAWIIGQRSDERFKIDSETKKIMILEVK